MVQLSRLLREPLLHFVAIGGLIFGVYAAFNDTQKVSAEIIVITPERVNQLAAGFASVWKRMPTEDERAALVDDFIREEVYYREALALGLDNNDTVVRRRLRQKMEFLTDVGADLLTPAAGELEAYFTANEKTFRSAPRLAFEQIYFGEAPNPDGVAGSLSLLQSDPANDPMTLGTRTLLPAQLGISPPNVVDGVFGQGFFEQLAVLPTGAWAGPATSSYGVHLVRILDRQPAKTPVLEDMRDTVLSRWRAAKALELRERHYSKLRERYVVKLPDWSTRPRARK